MAPDRSVGAPRRPDQSASSSTKSPSGRSSKPSRTPARSTWIWSTHSRHAVSSTAWSVSSFRPCCGKKVRPSLSAGRVQSVAVRLIVEREREIIAFRSAPYFRVVAQFYAANDPEKALFKAESRRASKRRPRPRHSSASCIGATFTVSKAEEKPAQRFPAPPVHDLHAPARGGPQAGHVRFADNVRRPAPLRAGSHHLHAYRLGKPSQQALAQCKEEITRLYGENIRRGITTRPRPRVPRRRTKPSARRILTGSQSRAPRPKKTLRPDLEAHRSLADGLRRTRPHNHCDRHVGLVAAIRRHGRSRPLRRLPAPLLESTDDDQAAESGEGAAPPKWHRATNCFRRRSPPRNASRRPRHVTTKPRWSSASKSWASDAPRPTRRPSRRSSTAATWSSKTGRGRNATTCK